MCDESGAVAEETILNWPTNVIPNILQRFLPSDIFNGDETGLFWKMTPHRTLLFACEK